MTPFEKRFSMRASFVAPEERQAMVMLLRTGRERVVPMLGEKWMEEL